MKRKFHRAVCLGFLVGTLSGASVARGGELFDNTKLISMLDAGITLSVIQKKIEHSACEFNDDSDELIKVKLAAQKGGMKPAAVDELLVIVIDKAHEKKKRLKELVVRFVNGCVNYEPQEFESIMRMLLREGKAVVPHLLTYIEEEDERKRAGILESLGRIGDKSAKVVASVTLMLQDRHPAVRQKAAKAVSDLSNETTCDDLIAALEKRAVRHLDGLAMALGYLKNAKAIGPLTTLLARSTDRDGRLAAAFSLGYLRAHDPMARKVLLDAILDDRDSRLRVAAAKAVALIGDVRGVDFVKRAYHRYRESRGDLIRELGPYKVAHSIEFLIECTESDDPKVRKAALQTLPIPTGEEYENAEEWRGWWSINKDRPEWVKVEEGVKPSPRVSNGGTPPRP